MKNRVSILLFLLLSSLATQAKIDLGGKWKFKTDVYNVGKQQNWVKSEKHNWDVMNVPGCWNTHLEYSQYTGVAWYATSFTTATVATNEDVILTFEGVYFDATVWLNGELLGTHYFGFTEFSFDVTNKLKQNNELVLRVDNTFKLGAAWNWGGIRRPVTLEVLPKQRVERVSITSTPNLMKKSADVIVDVALVGEPNDISISIFDAQGNKIEKSKKVEYNSNKAVGKFTLKNVNLWNFNTPYLYSVEVKSGERVVKERFGIRSIKIDGYKLLINGVETRLNGANYVAYDRFTGNMLPEDIYKRDIDMMKECGVNMARLSHLALPKDVLNYIDEKGILILEEIPNWNKSENVSKDNAISKSWLYELITQRYNHPSIIGWSVGNEIGKNGNNPELRDYLVSAFKYIKSIDSTRLTAYVSHTAGGQPDEPILLSDILLSNKYGGHGADKLNQVHSGKPIFMSEYGTTVNDDDINNKKINITKMMESMRGRKFLIGASIWTFNDYRSNYRDANTLATQNRPWGVVDAYGRKKRHYWDLQRENSPLKIFLIEKTNDNIKVELQSRDTLDLPAFDVDGYCLKVKGVDSNGAISIIADQPLKSMKIGSAATTLNFIDKKQYSKIYAELISPVGYTVHIVENYLVKPQTPSIEYLESSDKAIRVYYQLPGDATEIYAIVTNDKGQELDRQKPSIDNNITITDLEYDLEYSIELVAVNGAGESIPSKPMTIKTTSGELPPVIVHLKQRGENIEVGYTSSNDDYIYEFEYGVLADKMTNHVITTEFGACNLPVIDCDSSHYLRIRKRLRYGYPSAWSKIQEVEKN